MNNDDMLDPASEYVLWFENRLRYYIRGNNLASLSEWITKHAVEFDINDCMHKRSMAPLQHDMILGTPLQYAASENRLAAVKLLIDHGAHINVNNNKKQSALTRAIESFNSWYGAISNDHNQRVELIEYLILAGADVNFQISISSSSCGTTSLMLLCERHYHLQNDANKIIDLLLSHGADRSIKNKKGQTAEMIARDIGRIVTADYIRDYEQLPGTKGCFE